MVLHACNDNQGGPPVNRLLIGAGRPWRIARQASSPGRFRGRRRDPRVGVEEPASPAKLTRLHNRNDHTGHVAEDFEDADHGQLVRRYALRAVVKHLHSRVEAPTLVPLGQAEQVVGDESFDNGRTGCATDR
jgi:hypothetical protein